MNTNFTCDSTIKITYTEVVTMPAAESFVFNHNKLLPSEMVLSEVKYICRNSIP